MLCAAIDELPYAPLEISPHVTVPPHGGGDGHKAKLNGRPGHWNTLTPKTVFFFLQKLPFLVFFLSPNPPCHKKELHGNDLGGGIGLEYIR